MPEVLAVSAPPSPPSPQKVEKSAPEKSAKDETAKADEREFSDVLEEATETPPAEAAMLDPTAAIAAAAVVPGVVDGAAADGGELGLGGSPAMSGRLPAGAQPLRPEARAALGSALPEASAANDPVLESRGDDASMQSGEDAQRFEARANPGKPFELAADKAIAPANTERVAEAEAPAASQAPANAADAAAEAQRRERPATLKLDTHLPVHSPRFAEGFNQQVVVLAQHGIQQAQLSLTPPDLGPIDVRITVAHDEASVQIAAPSGVAREAIQEALPKLKEMMEQSGVRLNDANVFAQLPQRDPQAGAQQRAEWWQQQQQMNGGAQGAADEQAVPTMIRHLGLVDAYA